MSQPFKVHELLKDAPGDREALEVFAREPGRTIDECHEWLLSRGYTMSRTAVANWLADWREQLMRERMSGSGKLASAFMEAAKSDGGLKIPDAAVMTIAQMIFEHGSTLAAGGEVDAKDLATMSLAMQRLMLAKARLEATRSEFIEREKAAIEAADKKVKAGASAGSVVEAIKQSLGIGVQAA
jgi:hypothetical protein